MTEFVQPETSNPITLAQSALAHLLPFYIRAEIGIHPEHLESDGLITFHMILQFIELGREKELCLYVPSTREVKEINYLFAWFNRDTQFQWRNHPLRPGFPLRDENIDYILSAILGEPRAFQILSDIPQNGNQPDLSHYNEDWIVSLGLLNDPRARIVLKVLKAHYPITLQVLNFLGILAGRINDELRIPLAECTEDQMQSIRIAREYAVKNPNQPISQIMSGANYDDQQLEHLSRLITGMTCMHERARGERAQEHPGDLARDLATVYLLKHGQKPLKTAYEEGSIRWIDTGLIRKGLEMLKIELHEEP